MSIFYSREMINLVYKIRRHAPNDLKSQVKLANTSLLDNLIEHAKSSPDTTLTPLIEKLVDQVGEPWVSQFKQQEKPKDIRDIMERINRGTITLEQMANGRSQASYFKGRSKDSL